MSLWNREPALILGVLNAGIALAVGFGLNLTSEQIGLIVAFSSAVLALLTRSQVSSPSTVNKIKGTGDGK